MDLLYYNTRITDELDDSIAYIKRAFCLKDTDSDKASLYKELSSTELNHAKILIGMFEDDYKKEVAQFENAVPSFYTDVHKCLNDMYLEQSAKIQLMHQQYSNK